MKYCTKCGTEVQDNSVFCGNCGNRMSGDSTSTATNKQGDNMARQRKKLHCPQCKSTNITATVETESSVGASYRVSKRVAVGGSTHTSHTFWLCRDCGVKFWNIQSLEQEIKRQKQNVIVAMVLIGLFAAFIFVFSLVLFRLSGQSGPLVPIFLFMVATCVIAGLILRKHVNKFRNHLTYLQKNCFD